MYFMGKFLTSYFYYSRSERNGVVLLATLSFSVLMFTKIYSLMNKPSNTIADFTAFEQEIAAFTSQQASDTEGSPFGVQNEEAVLFAFNPNDATKDDFMRLGLSPKVATTLVHYREKGGRFFKKEDLKKIYGLKPTDYARLESYVELGNNGGFDKRNFGNTHLQRSPFGQYKDAKKTPHAIELKPFDPNTASEDDLLGLGLDEKSVKILLKYREKGGHFKTKEDLRKVYGLSDIDFLRIQSYIQIADNQFVAKNTPTTTQNSALPKKIDNTGTVTVELNTANLEELVQIRGIGRTFAARIIEHRERLGGFASLNQLKEVYGLPDSTIHNITPTLRLTAPQPRRIQVNKFTVEELTHPYLSRKQAEAIVRYRINHGSYKNLDDLKKTGVINDLMALKLQPYLSFD